MKKYIGGLLVTLLLISAAQIYGAKSGIIDRWNAWDLKTETRVDPATTINTTWFDEANRMIHSRCPEGYIFQGFNEGIIKCSNAIDNSIYRGETIYSETLLTSQSGTSLALSESNKGDIFTSDWYNNTTQAIQNDDCLSGEYLAGFIEGKKVCLPVPETNPEFYCTGDAPINAKICSGDNFGLTQNTQSTLTSGCTEINKCEHICKSGYILNNNICERIPTCTDGIQNSNENGIDCGGQCTECNSCNDDHTEGEISCPGGTEISWSCDRYDSSGLPKWVAQPTGNSCSLSCNNSTTPAANTTKWGVHDRTWTKYGTPSEFSQEYVFSPENKPEDTAIQGCAWGCRDGHIRDGLDCTESGDTGAIHSDCELGFVLKNGSCVELENKVIVLEKVENYQENQQAYSNCSDIQSESCEIGDYGSCIENADNFSAIKTHICVQENKEGQFQVPNTCSGYTQVIVGEGNYIYTQEGCIAYESEYNDCPLGKIRKEGICEDLESRQIVVEPDSTENAIQKCEYYSSKECEIGTYGVCSNKDNEIKTYACVAENKDGEFTYPDICASYSNIDVDNESYTYTEEGCVVKDAEFNESINSTCIRGDILSGGSCITPRKRNIVLEDTNPLKDIPNCSEKTGDSCTDWGVDSCIQAGQTKALVCVQEDQEGSFEIPEVCFGANPISNLVKNSYKYTQSGCIVTNEEFSKLCPSGYIRENGRCRELEKRNIFLERELNIDANFDGIDNCPSVSGDSCTDWGRGICYINNTKGYKELRNTLCVQEDINGEYKVPYRCVGEPVFSFDEDYSYTKEGCIKLNN